MSLFVCGSPACSKPVKAIYCPEHRQARAELEQELRQARSEAMKERWRENRAEMIEAIRQGRENLKE